jgi:hypothetical protein
MRVRELVVALALALGVGAATPAAATETAAVDPALLRQVKAEYAWHRGRPHRVYRRYGFYRPYRRVYRPYGFYRPYPVYGYPYDYPYYGYGRPGIGVHFRLF